MDHPADEKDQEVDSGHSWVGVQEGVDSSKEQEGVDVLHVIAMCPRRKNRGIRTEALLLQLEGTTPTPGNSVL